MTSYPIDEILPELKAAIREHSAVVLQAPPGSGKTTRVPLALLDLIPPQKGRILMLEPRRIAAVSAARWMAKSIGEEIGQTLGYSIRFDSRVSKETRIEVMTEGILTRRILANPGLEGVAMVIFDEFHERSLQADLALALCLDIRRALREDLKILVMSATLDGGPVAALLDGAAVITSQGTAYPVEERYCGDGAEKSVTARMTDVVLKALQEALGDILVFLPGAGEIRAVTGALEERLNDKAMGGISLHPLYGDLPFEEQQRAILPGPGRKVVLATNIAETSLTIEGVSVVIDSGLTRRLQYDPRYRHESSGHRQGFTGVGVSAAGPSGAAGTGRLLSALQPSYVPISDSFCPAGNCHCRPFVAGPGSGSLGRQRPDPAFLARSAPARGLAYRAGAARSIGRPGCKRFDHACRRCHGASASSSPSEPPAFESG